MAPRNVDQINPMNRNNRVIAPPKIVGGSLVCSRTRGSVVGFDQHEARGIVHILHDIEARHAWLLHALAGIGQGGDAKCLDPVRLDVDLDEHDVECVGHGQRIARYRETGSSGAAS